jgi:topoisomerase-4 subunit A
MGGFEGYWVHGDKGHGHPVADHALDVVQQPEKYGLSDAEVHHITGGKPINQYDSAPESPRGRIIKAAADKGWVRVRTGHGHDQGAFAFKAGDGLYGTFECRSVDTLLVFGSNGRIYSVAVSLLPGGRGDGQPVTTLIELETGSQILHYFAGPANATLLLSGTGGYGFLANVENMISRQKAGKAFVTCNAGETLCRPSLVSGAQGRVLSSGSPAAWVVAATHVVCASTGGRILTFEISELKAMANGGRGLMLIDLEAKDTLAGAAAYTRSIRIDGIGRGGKERDETLEIRSLNNARAARGRKGKAADLGFKPTLVTRVE